MKRVVVGAFASVVGVASTGKGYAEAPLRLDVLTPHRLELALTSLTRVGVADGFELGVQVPTVWLYPALVAKQRLLKTRRALLSGEYRLSYPTRFFSAVAKEGSLGLLPPTTELPVIVEGQVQYNASLAWRAEHWLTASAVLSVAPRLSTTEPMPLLDFPFLYQRFASSYAPFSAVYGAHADGTLGVGWYYHVAGEWFVLPIENAPGAWAWEGALAVGWAGRRWRFELGWRVAETKLPVGVRWHSLPTLDVGYRIDL